MQPDASSPHRHTLSVCIIAKNEADRLPRCLASVAGIADEIIVLDSGSTDGTVEVARQYTDKVWVTDWPGFGIQKQRALDRASMDWVLSIDADEALDESAQEALEALLSSPRIEETAFRIKWLVVRHGKGLKFGRSARAPLRLFRREGARFTDAQVHETIVPAPGKIGRLPGRLLHFTARDYGHALEKNAKYAWLGSQKYFAKGKRNRSLLLVCLRSLWTFFLIYVLRGGFLDGRIGFIVAMNYMQGNFNKHAGLWLLTREERQDEEPRDTP
ncbi:glycosyltransferase family 2 protein [Halomonas campisalis]|uniref:Glycosyltransferase family 2 protein n=1 Tax=Billgrantia campisalis TaxID=74661 RepID=A0ABS9P4K7_9GAMM|nr:glycosyltransferase family 2 protein [Halomonas campisalis]MCG6656708.1 glycosyltransferase family 2 protein [Halomonas campisalis]MDR5861897.1 glycosyltransferase family 2 protein [Halomonas campisalis]